MSMSLDTVKKHANDPAVTCCRTEAGVVITADHLEDPTIFPDLEDSGLLKINDNTVKVGDVLGAKLTKTVDALVPLTLDVLDGVTISRPAEKNVKQEPGQGFPAPLPVSMPGYSGGQGGILRIHIGSGSDIDLEIPVGALGGVGGAGAPASLGAVEAQTASTAPEAGPRLVRSLKRKHFAVREVRRGPETKFDGETLYIREGIEKDAADSQELVVSVKLDIITPDKYGTYSETIMDVQPIAAKEGEDKIGSGATRLLDGAVMMITGTDEDGVQIGEFGSSEGILEENIMWGRPGAPDKGEIFIKTEIVIKRHTNMERPGPLAAHKATDIITQEIRAALKKLDDKYCISEETFEHYRRPGKPKVVIVKEIMGQGAMHDNLILPVEPVGVLGGKANVDLGNVPIVMSPLEVLDGAIHALTCIGPASKECSRHYFREPLVLEALSDEEVDLCGVIFIGSPQINNEKFYVSERLGMTVELMDVDGAFVTTEGFGNNHIDFASHIEQIGKRGVPVVGMSYTAVQGAVVVGNEFMKYMIDHNKSEQGIENEVLACNTLTKEDALRALAMLKTVMAGGEVKEAERKWNPNVKESNLELVEKAYGVKIERADNETSIPMSKKRQEKYS